MDPVFAIKEENPYADKVGHEFVIVGVIQFIKFFGVFLALANNLFKKVVKFLYSVAVRMDPGSFNIVKIFVDKAFCTFTDGIFVFSVIFFDKNKIYNANEVHARTEILLESYSKTINIEALTMLDMARKDIFPAVSRFVGDMSGAVLSKKNLCASIPCDAELKLITTLSTLLEEFDARLLDLEAAVEKAHSLKADALTLSRVYCNDVLVCMNKLRKVSDKMEQLTSSDYWPYPSYGRLMFTM